MRSSTASSSGLPREMALPTTTRSTSGRDVRRVVSAERLDLLGGQKVAHRRIDVLIRSANVVASALEQRGQRGHRRAADANQMDPLAVSQRALPRRRSTGAGGRSGARRRPAAASSRVPRYGPTEIRRRPDRRNPCVSRCTTSRAVTPPPGSSQDRISPNTRPAARDRARRSAAAASACDRSGTAVRSRPR